MQGHRIWLALACSLIACDVEVDADEVVAARSELNNAIELNSAVLNGMRLNGIRTNGWSLNGWSLNGWSLNGVALEGVTLDGSVFSATRIENGEPVVVSGTELIGSRLLVEKDSVVYTMIFDDIYLDPAAPSGDVYFYEIRVLDPDTNTWSSLCLDHNGQPTQAIPIANYWDTVTGDRIDDATAVTFACRDAVLAKCVEWGYRPWAVVGGASLADHHQTCTRMARADYCGDGTAHTFNGTPIDIFDQLSPPIQSSTTQSSPNWGIEAEWGPDGALCVGDQLRLKIFDDFGIPYTYPPCLDDLDDLPNCGDFSPSRGAALANRYCDKHSSDPDACKPEA